MTGQRMKVAAVLVVLASSLCFAGERLAGKYCGVVIFDRWGGCTLYSGIYVMYVSEAVKDGLRPKAGQCVQIDATQVKQEQNPGDGLIQKFTLLDHVPEPRPWESPAGMKISVAPAFQEGQAPQFVIRVQNVSDKPVTLNLSALAPSLLASKTKGGHSYGPSDGPSTMVVTRQAFWIGFDRPRLKGSNATWLWEAKTERTLKKDNPLQPKEVFEIPITFKLPAGEYQFLAGYGGGVHAEQCIASNLIAFDTKADGTARLVKEPRR